MPKSQGKACMEIIEGTTGLLAVPEVSRFILGRSPLKDNIDTTFPWIVLSV